MGVHSEISKEFLEEVVYNRKYDMIHTARVMYNLYEQQKKGKHCDLKVLVKEHHYYVHRCVMATASEQLNSQITDLDTIQLVGVTQQGFEFLVEVLYTGKLLGIATISYDAFHQLVSAADALDASAVMDYCLNERPELMNKILQSKGTNPEKSGIAATHLSRTRSGNKSIHKEKTEAKTDAKEKLTLTAPPQQRKEPLSQRLKRKRPDTETFPCKTCGKICSTAKELENHKADHDREHGCLLCGKIFRYYKSFAAHMEKSACATRLNCFYCGKKFRKQSFLKRHVTMHHIKKNNYTVSVQEQKPFNKKVHSLSKKQFAAPVKKSLNVVKPWSLRPPKKDHKETEKEVENTPKPVISESKPPTSESNKSEEIKSPAQKIPKLIVNTKTMEKTNRSPDEEENPLSELQCKICLKEFDSVRSVKYHSYQVHRTSYRCKVCKKKFTDYTSFNLHKKESSCFKYDSVPCPICSRTFKRPRDLKLHTTSVHKKSNSLINKNLLEKVHTIKRGEDGLFRCLVCHAGLARRFTLQEHMKMHLASEPKSAGKENKKITPKKPTPVKKPASTNDSGFACIQCGDVFDTLAQMRRHTEDAHGGGGNRLNGMKVFNITPPPLEKKRLSCNTCGEAFTEEMNLLDHMLSHAEKKYQCHVCNDEFNDKHSLHDHLWIHRQGKIKLEESNDKPKEVVAHTPIQMLE